MRHFTNTDWTTAVVEKKGGLLTERGVQKGYEYKALFVCVWVPVTASRAGHGREGAVRMTMSRYIRKEMSQSQLIGVTHTRTHIYINVHVTCRLMQMQARTKYVQSIWSDSGLRCLLLKGGQVVCMLVCATSKTDGACALRQWLKTGTNCVFVCKRFFVFF